MDDVLSFFSDSTLYDRPATQPVITTVQAAQQTFPKQRSDATVIVFTDSPSSDATPWSHRFTDQNAEQNVLQISLLWKSRYFLSLPAGTDYASDGVDVYRRLSLTNHGDTFFLHGASDLANSLLMVMGSQYYSGSVTLGYKTSDNIDLTMSVDNPGDTVYFLLTIDPVTKSAMPTITRATLHADGTFYRVS